MLRWYEYPLLVLCESVGCYGKNKANTLVTAQQYYNISLGPSYRIRIDLTGRSIFLLLIPLPCATPLCYLCTIVVQNMNIKEVNPLV